MNCKPGDLAVRIKSFPGSTIPVGAVVVCVRFVGHAIGEVGDSGRLVGVGDAWEVEYKGSSRLNCGKCYAVSDDHLMPIRNQPGEDETLQWAPVPGQKLKESA